MRQYILHYFGEHAPDTCSACYNCLHNFEEVDVSRDAKAIVACIAKTGQHFGVGVIAETLCGADTERVRKYHMDREDTYGALGQLTQKEVQERIRFLLGILKETPGIGLDPAKGDPRLNWDDPAATATDVAYQGKYYLIYFGNFRPSFRDYYLDDDYDYEVEVIDTWNMTIDKLGRFRGKFRVNLPGREYMAIRIRRV